MPTVPGSCRWNDLDRKWAKHLAGTALVSAYLCRRQDLFSGRGLENFTEACILSKGSSVFGSQRLLKGPTRPPWQTQRPEGLIGTFLTRGEAAGNLSGGSSGGITNLAFPFVGSKSTFPLEIHPKTRRGQNQTEEGDTQLSNGEDLQREHVRALGTLPVSSVHEL